MEYGIWIWITDMVKFFVFMFIMFIKKVISVVVVCPSISNVHFIKIEFVLIGVFLGLMVIIGSLSGSDTFPTYVLRGVFDVF